MPLQDLQYSEKKHGLAITVEETSPDYEPEDRTKSAYRWQPGFKARFPWIGFIAIKVVLLCISLSIVVLGTSDLKTQEQWPCESTSLSDERKH